MTGLDTNVLVRYVVQDDESQSPIATRLIESLDAENPGFVALVVTVELSWVLSRSYRLGREAVADVIERLLRSRELVVDSAADVTRALRRYRAGSADFSDCLITALAERAGCGSTVTFDRRASRDAGMTLLENR